MDRCGQRPSRQYRPAFRRAIPLGFLRRATQVRVILRSAWTVDIENATPGGVAIGNAPLTAMQKAIPGDGSSSGTAAALGGIGVAMTSPWNRAACHAGWTSRPA